MTRKSVRTSANAAADVNEQSKDFGNGGRGQRLIFVNAALECGNRYPKAHIPPFLQAQEIDQIHAVRLDVAVFWTKKRNIATEAW